MSFLQTLERFADWREKYRPTIVIATVSVCPETARRKFRIRKSEPLEYRGLKLNCIGSARWRAKQEYIEAFQKRHLQNRGAAS